MPSLVQRSLERLRDAFAEADGTHGALQSHLVVADARANGALEVQPKPAHLGLEIQSCSCASYPLSYEDAIALGSQDVKYLHEAFGNDKSPYKARFARVRRNKESGPAIGYLPDVVFSTTLFAVPSAHEIKTSVPLFQQLGADTAQSIHHLAPKLAEVFPSPPPLLGDSIHSAGFHRPLGYDWWIFVLHHIAWHGAPGSPISGKRFSWANGRRFPHPAPSRSALVRAIGTEAVESIEKAGLLNRYFVSELKRGVFRSSAYAIDVVLDALLAGRGVAFRAGAEGDAEAEVNGDSEQGGDFVYVPDPVSNKDLAGLAGVSDADKVSRLIRAALKKAGCAVKAVGAGRGGRDWTHRQLRRAYPHLSDRTRLKKLLRRAGFEALPKPAKTCL